MRRLVGLALVGALAFTFVGSPASRALARDVNKHALVFQSLRLTPSTPFTGDTLRVDAVASDTDLASFAGIPVTYTYEWSRNGIVLAGETGPTLDLSTNGNGDRGDTISVRVTASAGELTTDASTSVVIADSAPTLTVSVANAAPASGPDNDGNGDHGDGAVASAEATVVNSAPTVAVSLDTTTPTTRSVIMATVLGQDIDNDGLSYVYTWRLNDVVKRTITTTAPTDRYDLSVRGNGGEGEVVTVTVTATDGSLTSPGASVSATIQNP